VIVHALVIDDARVMRLILKQILQQIGFGVSEAVNGREGLEQLGSRDRTDVALVDCHMPDMDGLAFVRAVRADGRYGDVRLLMVSAEQEQSHLTRALEAGADAYILKPFTKEVIREKLQQLGLVPG
jgi:two-component system chemotaxis response regulator CheY